MIAHMQSLRDEAHTLFASVEARIAANLQAIEAMQRENAELALKRARAGERVALLDQLLTDHHGSTADGAQAPAAESNHPTPAGDPGQGAQI